MPAHHQWCWTVVSGRAPLCLRNYPGSSAGLRSLGAPSAPWVPSPWPWSLPLHGCHLPFLLLHPRLESLWDKTPLHCLPFHPLWLLLTCQLVFFLFWSSFFSVVCPQLSSPFAWLMEGCSCAQQSQSWFSLDHLLKMCNFYEKKTKPFSIFI